MSFLDEIRNINTQVRELLDRKHDLIQFAIRNGVKWQEMVFVCKLTAIQMYKEENDCCLVTAKQYIEDYICLYETHKEWECR